MIGRETKEKGERKDSEREQEGTSQIKLSDECSEAYLHSE